MYIYLYIYIWSVNVGLLACDIFPFIVLPSLAGCCIDVVVDCPIMLAVLCVVNVCVSFDIEVFVSLFQQYAVFTCVTILSIIGVEKTMKWTVSFTYWIAH